MKAKRCCLLLLFVVVVGAIEVGRTSEAHPIHGQSAADEAYFLVGFPTEKVTFVLLLTDPARIAQARSIIEQGQADHYIFGGTIVKTPVPWNPPWSYYVDPASVTFAHAFVEICDAHPQYVEEHLDEVGGSFLPHSYWCPWSSRLLREIPPSWPTASPTLSPTATPTFTATPTAAATKTPTPTPTATATGTTTATPTSSATRTSTATPTATATGTTTVTSTSTATPTATPTSTDRPAPTITLTPSSTSTTAAAISRLYLPLVLK